METDNESPEKVLTLKVHPLSVTFAASSTSAIPAHNTADIHPTVYMGNIDTAVGALSIVLAPIATTVSGDTPGSGGSLATLCPPG